MKLTHISSVLFSALLIAGCSHQTSPDEAGFQTTAMSDGGVFAIKSENALKGYESVYLKSVVAMPTAGAKLDQSEMAALEYAFEKAFVSNVGSRLPIVQTPGARTLVAEATLSEVMSALPVGGVTGNNPADAANTYGAGAVVGMGQSGPAGIAVSGTSLCVCSTRMKVRLSNQSGELLAVFSDSDFGSNIELDANGETNWSRVSDTFNHWCSEIGQQLAIAVGK